MSKRVVTASRLLDGHVVYLDGGGRWSEWIDKGQAVDTQVEADRVMAVAQASEARCEVVEPYLVDVMNVGGTLRAVSYREFIRANGPPVHPAFGKQAERRQVGE